MPLFHLYKKQLTESIRQKALELGFINIGFAKAEPVNKTAVNTIEKWIEDGKHGTMQWMERNREKRYNPTLLSEGAKTIISLAFQYYTNRNATPNSSYRLSKYACGKDYHYVMKEKLRQLLSFVEQQTGERKARIFVDSAPVTERYWAHRAGLGFIGKNTCLINRKHGSFFFIGNLIIDLELEYNKNLSPDFCGSCTRCIDACPTGALTPFELDARKCISYASIEMRGDTIPESFRGKMENYIFGCDICQDVCPWNRDIPEHTEPAFIPGEQLRRLTDSDWEQLEKPQFKKLFRHTPVERAGWKQLKRNIFFVKKYRDD